jgi:transcription-repair coupling factor (superfamily II helicase)
MLIENAERLGLAQLHQLRGRVGRSHHLAYAYLITPERRSLSRDAEKRLDAIASLEELGAGFTLATHDMEIRGTGELLGEEQSGQIQQVGFSLYSELLSRAVAALREGREPALDQPLHHGCEVELHVPALIPEDYLFDVHARLTLYKRIASAADEPALRELQVEMIDRFGLLPEPVRNLFKVTQLRQQATRLGLARLVFGPRGGRVEFTADTSASVDSLLALVSAPGSHYRLAGPERLSIITQEEDGQARLQQAAELLARLERPGDARAI